MSSPMDTEKEPVPLMSWNLRHVPSNECTGRMTKHPAISAGCFVIDFQCSADRDAFVWQRQVPERLDRCQRTAGTDRDALEGATAAAFDVEERAVGRNRRVSRAGVRDRGLGVQERRHTAGSFAAGTHVAAARI